MRAPYFFYFARSHEDPKLVRAGWEATMIWPHVLALLKIHNGVLTDQYSDPEYLAALLRCPLDIVTAGYVALRSVGLLAPGSRSLSGGSDGNRTVEGLVTPAWERWTKDKRPTVRKRNPPVEDRTPPVPHDNGVKRSGHEQLELEREQENKNKGPSAPCVEVWTRYRELQKEQGINRQERPTKDLQPLIESRIREFRVEDVIKVIEWAHQSEHPRAAHLREQGHLGKTLFRPGNFPEYLSFADVPEKPKRKVYTSVEEARRDGLL